MASKYPFECPLCGKKIARPTTKISSAKGLCMMHFKGKHPIFYDELLSHRVDQKQP